MKIIIDNSICKTKNFIEGKEYEVIDWDDDSGGTPDEYFLVVNEDGKKIWIDDWDCSLV